MFWLNAFAGFWLGAYLADLCKKGEIKMLTAIGLGLGLSVAATVMEVYIVDAVQHAFQA